MLMHGCKEGQCAACKSFVLEGEDIEHDKYSTFALPDYEKDEGYTLLCRAHVYEDVTIELLNYDEEMIRSGLPIQQAVAEVVSNDPVTHDMRHLVLRLVEPAEVKFFPGQYMDIAVPGTDQVRSFSMANTSSRDGPLEFVIKVYPDGLFSRFLDERLAVGDRLELTGPFGVFTLRDADTELLFVGGGAGMAPILSLLRTMAERGIQRKATFFYGARGERDLCFDDELAAIAEKLPDFTYIPALSHEDWSGETGLITDVVKRLADQRGRRARLRLRPAPDGRGGDPAADHARRRRKAHLLRQVHDNRRAHHDSRDARTQRSQAGLHRRRGGREGVPRLDRAQLQLLQARQAQADALRGRDRRGPARPAALPGPGLAVRVRRRPRRLPARLDRAQGVGLRPARARAVPRLRRQGLRLARARLARVPRPQRGVGAHLLPLQLQRRPAGQPERRERPAVQGVRAVEPELGALHGAERRRVDARRPRSRPLPVRERAAPGPHQHAQQRDLGQLACTGSGRPRTSRSTTSR